MIEVLLLKYPFYRGKKKNLRQRDEAGCKITWLENTAFWSQIESGNKANALECCAKLLFLYHRMLWATDII